MVRLDHLRQVASLDRSVVVIIDVQNDFCSPEGACYRRGGSVAPVQSMLPTLAHFLDDVRSRSGRIIFVRHEQPEAATLMPAIRRRDQLLFGGDGFPLHGSWGADFCPPICPLPDEPVIVKHCYSAFSAPELVDALQRSGIETLILSGVFTNVCVETTAGDTDARGYGVVVVADCVASDTPKLHRAVLANIGTYFGWVCSANELIASWQQPAGQAEAS